AVLLSDKSIKHQLKRVSLDDNIFTKVGVSISDIMAISYMKVKVSLNPIGNWITWDSLNVPGQSFEGAIENNHIQGTFEISHKKYDGQNPPPFPPDFTDTPELAALLTPEDLIESDDPVLVKKAKDLTKGAADAWEASKRLSKWVAEEIGYDIPGGGSARNTYDLKAGECGAHSRLFTALCRAVGIPSRVVWGCIYVPNNGGSFGQHGWNEVYMGEAGWIPVDTTAREIDFADSGHIRLGILSSKHIAYNPDKIEIQDFHSGSQRFGEAKSLIIPEKYKPYLGKFQGPKRVLRILVQNNSLAIDIPGQMIFEFNDPDENGLWYFKLTRKVNVSFQKD
ncbi:transglutaminase domain-containing protein, partial [bacterium]|nr:transglutaminase domain-containing protein [bacterium]